MTLKYSKHFSLKFITLLGRMLLHAGVVVYRPLNAEAFLIQYNEMVSHISKENKVCHIMGDFNFNLSNNESHASQANSLIAFLLSFMLIPLISKPLRITANSATLIDNMFTNDSAHYLKCGLLFTDISDHFPVFAISDQNYHSLNQRQNKINKIRNFNETNRIKFSDILSNGNWFVVYNSNNSNEAYDAFVEKFSQIHDNCFSLKFMITVFL